MSLTLFKHIPDQLFQIIIAFKNIWYHQPKCTVVSCCIFRCILPTLHRQSSTPFENPPPPRNLACSQALPQIFKIPVNSRTLKRKKGRGTHYGAVIIKYFGIKHIITILFFMQAEYICNIRKCIMVIT